MVTLLYNTVIITPLYLFVNRNDKIYEFNFYHPEKLIGMEVQYEIQQFR